MSNMQLELRDNQSIDTKDLKASKDLKELQKELRDAKNKMTASDSPDKAGQFMPDLSVDRTNCVLRVGEKYIKAKDDTQLDKFVKTIEADIVSANVEIATWEKKLGIEQDDVIIDTHASLTPLKENVSNNKVEENTNTVTSFDEVIYTGIDGTKVTGAEKNDYFSKMQELIDQQKELKTQYEQFVATNAGEGAEEDVAKMFELTNKLDGKMTSNKALVLSALSAGSIAALQQQNEYLTKIVEGYQTKRAKFNVKEFNDKYQKRILESQAAIMKQFGLTPTDNSTQETEENTKTEKVDVKIKVKEKVKVKLVSEMNETEKVETLKQTIANLDGIMLNKKVVVDAATGASYIDLNKDEYDQFALLNSLTATVNDGKADINEVYDRDMTNGQRRRKKRSLKNEIKDEQQKSRDMKEIAGLEEQLARTKNDVNYFTNRANVTHGVSEVLSTGKYLGQTISYQPRSPLFVNICQSLDAFTTKGVINVNFAGNPNVLVRCPEMLNNYVYTNIDNGTKTFAGGEYKTYCPKGEHVPNVIEQALLKTNMTPEQARKNAALISTGGLLAGLFFGVKWLVSGKEGGKGFGGFMARAAMVTGGALGANMLSQGLTGRSANDILKDLWYGKLKFSDLMEGSVDTPALVAAQFTLRDMPYSVLHSCLKSNSDPLKLDFDKLETAQQAKIDATVDATERARWEQQLSNTKQLHADPKGQEYLDKALKDYKLNYSTISSDSNKEKTINFNESETRRLDLKKYELENNKKVDYKDADVIAYITGGKLSIDELAAKGKFTQVTDKQKNTTKKNTEVTPPSTEVEVTDTGLQNIDKAQAVKFQTALNAVNASVEYKTTNDRPTFEYRNNKLYLRSYGFETPISLNAEGKYLVWPVNQPMEDMQHVIKTASLINFLVLTNNGAWDNDKPFSITGNSLKVGNKELTGWNWFDKSAPGSWVNKYFAHTEVADGDDWKVFPWRVSALAEIGGNALSSEAGLNKLVNGLNDMKSAKGSIWNKTNGGVSSTSEVAGSTSWGETFPKKNVKKASGGGSSGGGTPEGDEDNNDNADNGGTTKKKPNKPETGGGNGGANKIEKTVAAGIAIEKAASWKNSYKLKDPTGKELPEDFYKEWIKAHNDQRRLFVFNGEVYDTNPKTDKPATLVDKKDTKEEADARKAAEALNPKKNFMNKREALIAGYVAMDKDNSMTCNPLSEREQADVTLNCAPSAASIAAREAADKAKTPFKYRYQGIADGDRVLKAGSKTDYEPKPGFEEVDTKDKYNYAVKEKAKVAPVVTPAPVATPNAAPVSPEKKTELDKMVTEFSNANNAIKSKKLKTGGKFSRVDSNVYTDASANVVLNGEVISLHANNQDILIHPLEKVIGQTERLYEIKYGDKILDVKFAKPEDVMKIAHLTTFLVEKLKRIGGSDTPFKLENDGGIGSAYDGHGIKFNEAGSRWNTEIFDADDKKDYAAELGTDSNVTVLKDRWNSLRTDWEEK